MSLRRFEHVVKKADLKNADRIWYPRWLKDYAVSCGRREDDEAIVVDREMVVRFLQGIKSRGLAAWQRLQAVRAIELYRNEVLRTSEPCLAEIRDKLASLAADEQRAQSAGAAAEEGPIGLLDENEPERIRQLRTVLRTRHYSRRTEQAYVGWVQRERKTGQV